MTASYETSDKLRIFVSSRIGECKEERTIIREAIGGINHLAVLFEHIGARPQSPRELYQSRLRDSQIMVAVYRSGYGYIDVENGMTISGLEDEYRLACQYGTPILLYVHADTGTRDTRLSALIDEIGGSVTRYTYRTSSELKERVRDDLTAVISQGYLSFERLQGVLSESSTTLLGRGVQRQGMLIARPELIDAIEAALASEHAVCVFGPPGIGKTTLAAQYAERSGSTYLRLTGLAPKDIFSVCADALKESNVASGAYATLNGARLGFSAAWADAEAVTLVLDECDYVTDIIAAVAAGGGFGPRKQLVFTSRQPSSDGYGVPVPNFTATEASQMMASSDLGYNTTQFETPLAIQEELAKAQIKTGTSAREREILSYLALSPTPIGPDQIIELLGDDQVSIEILYESLALVGRSVDDGPRGIAIVHNQIGESIIATLRLTPQRLLFYVTRLCALFEQGGDFRLAYQTALHSNDGSELKFASAALRQASISGDWRLGISIAERLLNSALDAERRSDAFELMMQLIYPLELMGEAQRATDLLEKAKPYAEKLGKKAADLYEEVRLGSNARRSLSADSISELQKIYSVRLEKGDPWERAKLGLELSALYIAAKEYEKAVEILRPTLDAFTTEEDWYGIDLAERNLASALSALPGHEVEVDQLVRVISERAATSVDPRRQRAWVCNILTRRYREAGRLSEAASVAEEAIAIANELGDEALAAITQINLGNVAVDAEDWKAALVAYDAAAIAAQRCARRDVEADASRLRASVLNDFAELSSEFPDRHERALAFARHAVGLLEGTIYHEARARSLLELADANEELGNLRDAANDYLVAEREFRQVPDHKCADIAFVRGTARAIELAPEFYLQFLVRLLDVDIDAESYIADQFVDLIGPIIRLAPRTGLVNVLGRHLWSIRRQLPPALRPALLEALGDALKSEVVATVGQSEPWRLLYPALLAPALIQHSGDSFLLDQFAHALARQVEGLSVRVYAKNCYLWTAVLNLGRPTTITVESFDESHSAAVAALCLASFLKAFEDELREMVPSSQTDEVWIQLISFSEMPQDIRQNFLNMGAEGSLESSQVAVTRPTSFQGGTPTFVILGNEFLENATLEGQSTGSIQFLLALSLTEVVHQLLRGEVDDDQVRPKIVTIIRRAFG